jgi:hypothetical protein
MHARWNSPVAPLRRSSRLVRLPMMLRSHCRRRRPGCCVGWRAAVVDSPTAVDIARRLADTLAREGVTYAVGGALALAYYATPRATVDVDINVFVSPQNELRALLALLATAGFTADTPETVMQTAQQDGQFRGRIDGVRVDVFVPAIPFYAEMASRTRAVPLLGRPIDILSPQDLLTLKMMFFRRKDVADVEAVLRHPPPGLDAGWVRAKLVDMVGEDDERIREWDSIVADVSAEK